MKQLRLVDVGNPRHAIEDFHYLGTMPSGKIYIFKFEDAVCVYSIPANKNIAKFLFGIDVDVWEFARCWAPDGHRDNLMSQAIAATIRMLMKAEPKAVAVVAYADPNVGHSGGVYKAASWTFTGQSKESRYYSGPDGKTVSRRSFHSGKNQLTKAQIEAKGYSEMRKPGKLRFVRGLKPWARKLLVEKFGMDPGSMYINPKDLAKVNSMSAHALTLSDAMKIRVLVSRGFKQCDLASQYRVSEQTISAIVNRQTHNHGLAEAIRRRKMGGPGKPKK